MSIYCKIGFHKWKPIATKDTKGVFFGDAMGTMIIEKCIYCGTIRKLSLNLSMPKKYMNEEYNHWWGKEKIWEE